MSSFRSISSIALGGFVATVLAAPPNPISVQGWVDYGRQVSSNAGPLERDLGFEGKLGNTYYVSYADTNLCTDSSLSNCHYADGNTLAVTTYVPNIVTDLNVPPTTFCSSNSDNSRLHTSGIVPISDTQGTMWYQNITYDGSSCGGEIDGCVVTQGVAVVDNSGSQPTCTALFPFWDPKSEPEWLAAVGPEADGYVYVTGQLDGNVRGGNLSDVYLMRVPTGSTYNYNAYQYWNGSAFTSQRLHYPAVIFPGGGALDLPSILQDVPAMGSITYNAYYQKYFILAVADYNSVVAYTASVPQGPWSAPTTIYTNSSHSEFSPLYAPCAQPRFDESGKTLSVLVSAFGLNNVEITFKTTFN